MKLTKALILGRPANAFMTPQFITSIRWLQLQANSGRSRTADWILWKLQSASTRRVDEELPTSPAYRGLYAVTLISCLLATHECSIANSWIRRGAHAWSYWHKRQRFTRVSLAGY